jgi:hypothetical protein
MDVNLHELEILFNLLEATSGPAGTRGRRQLLDYLQNPTVERWDAIQAYVLMRDPTVTLAAAVRVVDPSFGSPHRVRGTDGRLRWQWSAAPQRATVLDALKYAAFRWR